MSGEVKIPFGQLANGNMVSIDAVVRGLACECFCAACNGALVACKGEINQFHFRHHVEGNCAVAGETSLHKFAKQVLCETPNLKLPDASDGGDVSRLGPMRRVEMEVWLDGIRPDVLAHFDDEPIAIEIMVAHRVPTEKLKEIIRRGLAAFEIDLSRFRNTDRSEEQWRDLIVRTAPRFWLFQPAFVRKRIEAEALELRKRSERYEARKRLIRLLQEWRVQKQQIKIAQRDARFRQFQERERAMRLRIEERERAERSRIEREQNEREQKFLRGLKVCADTEFHLAQWQKRLAGLRK